MAAVLDVAPNELLGVDPRASLKKNDGVGRLRARINAACAGMNVASLALAVTLVEAVLEHEGQG